MAKQIQLKKPFLSILFVILLSFFPDQTASHSASATIPGFDCYRNSQTLQLAMQQLQSTYPELVQLNNIGSSYEGQEIQLLKVGSQKIQTEKPRLVLISGLRANSFAPVEVNLQFLEDLLMNYDQDASSTWILDFIEIYAIPLANPDGRLIAETQAQDNHPITWQNNTNPGYCPSNLTGVRLNHNFPFEWSEGNPDPCNESFHGPTSSSEPETQALTSFLEGIAADTNPTLLIHLDSFRNHLMTPYQYDENFPNPHEQELYTLANKLAYNTPANPMIGTEQFSFEITGNLLDFAFWELDIPGLAYKIGSFESGGHTTACWYFDYYLLEQTKTSLMRAAYASPSAYWLAYGPETEIVSSNSTPFSVTIEGNSNDYSFYKVAIHDYGSIEKLTWSVDLPPNHPQAEVQLVPELLEDPEYPFLSSFSLTIPYSEFEPGKHLLFFQAWDSGAAGFQSNPGFITSIFIEIPQIPDIPHFLYAPLIFR